MKKVAYLVHDLTDAAVWRRVRMLEQAGASVSLAGFSRGEISPLPRPCLNLGQTADAKLLPRAMSVARTMMRTGVLEETLAGADIVIARNLEMLAIAARARARFAPDASLIYECLDIHRLLLSGGPAGRLLRAAEAVLWRDTDVLLTSSPAFVRHYFSRRGFPGKIEIVENKVFEGEKADQVADFTGDRNPSPCPSPHGRGDEVAEGSPLPWGEGQGEGRFASYDPSRPHSPPWKIGWFGMLRCAKSLRILKEIAEAAGGNVEVIIRGKFSPAVFPNIDGELKDAPHIKYLGPYNGGAELARIYSEVHFSWAIDFYEESQNSAWLLPNRLYESCHAGVVPIALGDVETGRWLTEHGAGVLISEHLAGNLNRFFCELNGAAYAALARQVGRIPQSALVAGTGDSRRLVELLAQAKRNTAARGGTSFGTAMEAR